MVARLKYLYSVIYVMIIFIDENEIVTVDLPKYFPNLGYQITSKRDFEH